MDKKLAYLCLFLSLSLIPACADELFDDDRPIGRLVPQSQAEIDFITKALNDLQEVSIRENREYCGYLGYTADGLFEISEIRKGRKGSCRPKYVQDDFNIIASFHTHGADSEKYDSELPSYDDLAADIEEGVDGYIATPGGRIWYTDSKAQRAKLLCGRGCVKSDPNFINRDDYKLRASYTLEELMDATSVQ